MTWLDFEDQSSYRECCERYEKKEVAYNAYMEAARVFNSYPYTDEQLEEMAKKYVSSLTF